MVDKSDFQDDDGRSIDETAADLHEAVDEKLAEGEISDEDAADEHREIDAVAANVVDSIPYHDPEDPPSDDD